MGERKPPILLLAVQNPQKVPLSLSGYHTVNIRAQAGAPRPCAPPSITFTPTLQPGSRDKAGAAHLLTREVLFLVRA